MRSTRRAQALLQFGLFCGIVLFVNILAAYFYTNFDLTEEKRYTLTPPTKQLLRGLKDRIYVKILLDGNFPAGFKRLQTATRELLDDFRGETGLIDYQFENPNEGSLDDVNNRRKDLAEQDINPINLRVQEEGGASQQLVYPHALVHFGNRKIVVNLLENNSPTLDPNVAINNSVGLLEYKFANAIKKLMIAQRPAILFTRGHGELEELQTFDLERALRQFYDTDRITLDSVLQIAPKDCALLVVAKPRTGFSEKEKFKLDQYVMNGGKMLWLLDRMAVNLDSITRHPPVFIPNDYPLNLEDMLFRYGVRIQPDLVLDMQSTRIPLAVGMVGNEPQLELFPWPYHPAVGPKSNHPVVKSLDRVEMQFCSSIDTVRTKTNVSKTVLLQSSQYSRLQFSPIELTFNIVKQQPDPSKFKKGNQTVAVLLEGVFPSNFENRVSEEMAAGLAQIGVQFRPASQPTRMIVVSDGDVAANIVRDPAKKSWYPLGFNRYEEITYANKDFLLNAIEYLVEPDGVIAARSKEVKLRLLDSVKAKEQKTMWQVVNLALPLTFLGLFGLAFRWWRRRKFAA